MIAEHSPDDLKRLERQFQSYADQTRRKATMQYPYRPFALACILFLEGTPLRDIRARIEAEIEDWPHTFQLLKPILRTLFRLRLYERAGYLVLLHYD